MRLHIACPHCGAPTYATHKRQLSELVTEVSYECRAPSCGAAFIFQGEVIRQLRLPVQVNPRINVPLSPIVQRRALLDALENLRTADLPPEGEMFAAAAGQLDIFHAQGAHGP